MTEVLRYAAFTTTPEGGNPAGVVLDADGLTDLAMQAIAADVGYSETAFVRRGAMPRRRPMRYFSPLAEVPFCGHATIAASVALGEREGVGLWVFETPVGEIAVETSADEIGVVARMRSVATSSAPASGTDLDLALAALRWPASDLADLPVHVAFGGNHHLVVPAGSRERLADLDYDFEALKSLMTDRRWTTIQLVHIENETLIHARNPFPVGGIVEDPATGAAAAALGGYLRALKKIERSMSITIRQGEDMGRPSEILLEVEPDDPQVTISGRAVPMGI
ncbi:MAG: PhzF family phenazine biosynthesis protein [Nocardioidaceae bacterium]